MSPELINTIGTIAGVIVAALGAFLFAFWIAMGIWAFHDIRQRTRDWLVIILAVALVLIFPLIGLILYLMIRPKATLAEVYDRALEEEALLRELEQTAACHSCGVPVKEAWVYCPNCHNQLQHSCPTCGNLVRNEWEICVYCGSAQQRTAPQLTAAGAIVAGQATLQGTSKTMDGKATLIITSPVLATRLTVFDESGRVIQETDGETARLFLSEGLGNVQDQAVRQLKGLTTIAPFPPREQDRIQLGYLSLLIANQSASSNPVMRDLVDEVIRRPSLLGLLFNRSITLASDDRSPSSATTWTPPGGTPLDAAVVPYSLSAGGSEVLLPTFTTVRIRPPLGLCGGIVAMDAVRPGDPGVRLTVRLVSATRGHGRKDPGWSAPSYFRVPIDPSEGDEPKGP